MKENALFLYIGTWADPERNTSASLLVYRISETQEPACLQKISFPGNVGRVKADREKKLLFVSLEVREVLEANKPAENTPAQKAVCGGVVCIFHIEEDGKVRWQQDISSGGPFPIDLALEKDFLAVVNHGSTVSRICRSRKTEAGSWETYWEYEEASLVLYNRDENGLPQHLTDLHRFSGSGPLPFFQESAAPHSITVDASGCLLAVPQRGSDRTTLFRIQAGKVHEAGILAAQTGEGPRNAVFSGDGRDIYVLDEIEPVLTHFRKTILSDQNGEIECWTRENIFRVITEQRAKEAASDPCSFEAPHPVAIERSSDETFLYVLTRSTNTITVFARNPQNGSLSLRWEYGLSGKNPREMHRVNDWIYMSFLDTQNVLRLQVDELTGQLSAEESVMSGIVGAASFVLI